MGNPEVASNSETQKQLEANSVVETAMRAFQELKNKITPPTQQTIENAASAMREIKDHVEDASETVQAQLEVALDELPGTLNALPDALKTQAKENLNKIEQGRQTIFEKLKSGAKSGFEKVVDTLATTAETVGKFMNKMWEKLKPNLARIAETPGIAFLLGEKNLSALQGWLGYDADSVLMQQQFRDRLPDDVSFTITNKKEAIALNDQYKKMLEKKGKKDAEYPKEQFIADCIQGAKEQNILPIEEAGKKEYQMVQFVEAAKVLIEKEPQGTTTTPAVAATPPATTPVAPK